MARKASDTNQQYLDKCKARRQRTKRTADADAEKRQYVTDALMTLKLVENSHD